MRSSTTGVASSAPEYRPVDAVGQHRLLRQIDPPARQYVSRERGGDKPARADLLLRQRLSDVSGQARCRLMQQFVLSPAQQQVDVPAARWHGH